MNFKGALMRCALGAAELAEKQDKEVEEKYVKKYFNKDRLDQIIRWNILFCMTGRQPCNQSE